MTAPLVYRMTMRNIEAVLMTDGRQYSYWSGYTLTVPSLAQGDVVQLMAQFECNNPQDYAAQITCFIGRGEVYGATELPEAVDSAFPVAGSDVAPYGHFRAVCLAVDEGQVGDTVYSLMLETASTAVTAGAAVALNPGYGGLVALVFKQ